jgi:hypothetical protein
VRRFLLSPLALAALLLAPAAAHAYDVTIVAPGDPRGLTNNTGAPFFASTGSPSTLPANLIEAELNAGRDVTVDGGNGPGVAVIAAPITATTGSASLAIYAETAVRAQAPIAVGGDLKLFTGSAPDDDTGVDVDDRLSAGGDRTVRLEGNTVRASGAGRVEAGALDVLAARAVSLTGGNDVDVVSLFTGTTASVRTVRDVAVTGQAGGDMSVDGLGDVTLRDATAGGDLRVRAGGAVAVAPDAQVQATDTLLLAPAYDESRAAPDPAAGSGAVRLGDSSALVAPGGIGLWARDRSALVVAPTARLNGEPYVPGPVGVDSATERWGGPYDAVGTPYLVTYGLGKAQDPPVSDAPPATAPTVPAPPATAPTPAAGPGRPDTTAPRVTDLRHTRRMVRLRVDERSSVAVTVERRVVRVTRVGGRRVVRRSWKRVRTVAIRQAGPGLTTTRLRTRPFRGRSYRVTAVATDAAGNRSRPVRIVGGV